MPDAEFRALAHGALAGVAARLLDLVGVGVDREHLMALRLGAVGPFLDPRTATLIGSLGHPSLQIPAVADALGTTERSLRRWALGPTGGFELSL